MINDLQTLCQVVNDVANRALDHVAAHTQSGQMYLSYFYFTDLISAEDFKKYGHLIAAELSTRPEVLEPVSFVDGELDINMGLNYCKAYQWCEGDSEIFGCSFEEWLTRPAEPVHHPLSLDRLAEMGEKAVAFTLDLNQPNRPLTALDLGLRPSERSAFMPSEQENTEYVPGKDLYVGKWRIHVADTGEKHGPYMNLVNEKQPIAEFYDMATIDAKFAPDGLFTGAVYRVADLLERGMPGNIAYPHGLLLQADCPEWKVSPKEMKAVVAYLHSFETYKQSHKGDLSHMIDSAQHKRDCATKKTTTFKTPGGPER